MDQPIEGLNVTPQHLYEVVEAISRCYDENIEPTAALRERFPGEEDVIARVTLIVDSIVAAGRPQQMFAAIAAELQIPCEAIEATHAMLTLMAASGPEEPPETPPMEADEFCAVARTAIT